jgi:hypothetical protein
MNSTNVFHRIALVFLFMTAVLLTVAMHGRVPAMVFYGSLVLLGAAGWALARAFFSPSPTTELRSVAVSLALVAFSAAVRFMHLL